MPTVTKLAPETITAMREQAMSKRQRVAAQYDTLLGDFAVGDWGDVLLDADDERVMVSRRLKAAAARRGLTLRFLQRRDNRLRFRLIERQEPAADTLVRVGEDVTQPQAKPALTQATAPEQPGQPVGQRPQPVPPARPRPTATDRYRDVLPRWMRDGSASGPTRVTKRRTR